MNLSVKKTSTLRGHVSAPASKSQTIRALLLASLAEGESVLSNVLRCNDTEDAINVCRNLGAHISPIAHDHTLVLQGTGLLITIAGEEINTGNSGITTHFVMPLLGLRDVNKPIVLNCGNQMRERPIKSLVDALVNLGLNIDYLAHANQLPVRISGHLKGGKTEVDGTTSQYLSALLFALPLAPDDSEIQVKQLQERPYVEMTLHFLKQQGIQFNHRTLGDTDIYEIKGNQKYKNFNTTIAGDFSSAAFLIAAAALIPGEVIVQGLNMADAQGDKRLVTLLQTMGADIVIEDSRLLIHGGKPLNGISIDASDIPDLLPILAVIATVAQGKTEIVNVAHARIKETDRIHAIASGLIRMGAKVIEKHDGLTIYQSNLKGSAVKGFDDHRTVMALGIAGLIAEGETVIDDCEAIHKTFPHFIQTMQTLGATMEVEHAFHA